MTNKYSGLLEKKRKKPVRSGEGEVKLMLEYARRMIMSLEAENYEMVGRIDKNHHLVIDGEVPLEPGEVKVVVYPQKDAEGKSKADRFNSFRGALKGWKVDGLEFQKELRKEWDDR